MHERQQRFTVDPVRRFQAEGVQHRGKNVHVLRDRITAGTGTEAAGMTNEQRAAHVLFVKPPKLAAWLALQVVIAEPMTVIGQPDDECVVVRPSASSFSNRWPSHRSV